MCNHISSIYDNRSHVLWVHFLQIFALCLWYAHDNETQSHARYAGEQPEGSVKAEKLLCRGENCQLIIRTKESPQINYLEIDESLDGQECAEV